MADLPQIPTPWWIALLNWIKQFIKDNWSGIAVAGYEYEEKKVDAAKQEGKTAALQQQEAKNENDVLKENAGLSDGDIIRKFGGGGGGPDNK